MTRDDLNLFEKLVGQVQGLYDELALLSKKSPNDGVNTFKLRFINKLLAESNSLLGAAYRPFDDFSEFDLDDVPQNSDVVFILSQYLQCLEKLRADNVKRRRIGVWEWVIEAPDDPDADENGHVYVPTVTPRRLRE